MFGVFGTPIRRSNRGNLAWHLPSSHGTCRKTVKLRLSATQISFHPPPQGLRRHGSVFLLVIPGAVADDGLVHRVHCDLQVR